jgi:hypothetical protein
LRIDMALLMTFVALPLLALVISAGIALRLLLGLRLASVTTCRGCGANLWGMRKAICPTCGGDRRVPRSRRGADGGRSRVRRRRRAVAAMAFLATLTGVWLGFVIAYVAAGARWGPHKPTWLLTDEAVRAQQALDDSGQGPLSPDTENAALTELTNRIPKLGHSQLQALIDRALALQEDDVATGRAQQNARCQWYSLVERAHGLGLVAGPDWARYLSQGADGSLALLLRNQVTRGDPLVLAINCTPVFGGGLDVSFESDRVPTIAGHKVGVPHAPAASVNGLGNPPDETVIDLPPDLLSSLTDGPQNTDVTAVVNVRDKSLPAGPPIYRKSITLHGVWMLQPASSRLTAPSESRNWIPWHRLPGRNSRAAGRRCISRGIINRWHGVTHAWHPIP